MNKIRALLFSLFPALVFAQQDSILSGRYAWKQPSVNTGRQSSSVLFEGKATDMKFLQMSTNRLKTGTQPASFPVPGNEEQLLLLKSGKMTLSIGDSTWSLGKGSVALLLPGERYTMQNKGKEDCDYYLMRYRSVLPPDTARGKAAGGSLVKDWDQLVFRPHDRGGVRNYFNRPTAMCKRLEMHVTTLNEGIKSHEPHTHRAEEIILVIDNQTEMQIGENFYKGSTGDIYYLGSNVAHAIRNDGKGPCLYFAIQFE